MKPVLAGLGAVALLACSPQGQPLASSGSTDTAAGKEFKYACAGGKTFSVSYDADFTVATVKAGASTFKLPAVISASGARYSDGKVEFWEHQGEAILTGTPDGSEEGCPEKKAD